ncbi:sensor histidine kinase [Sanyastnella coralliicola]|uniref:sensor histidine kinase n=1 Tax=Sanyastnella coralliicola TaxID=3069118 RepID=UPI0027BA7C15|nr:histidine kinase [Longitalea sp. SCSIO 12813]
MKIPSRIYHLLVWLAVLLYYMIEEIINNSLDLHSLLLNFTHILAHASAFYVFYPHVWKRVVPRRQWGYLIVGLLAGVGVFILSRVILQEVIVEAITGRGNYRYPWTVGYILDNMFRPIPTILASLIVWLVGRQNEMKRNEAILGQEKANAELAFLRGQVNPHFLFNTLGFIHSKVYAVDPETAAMTEELSSILRKAFTSAKEGQNTLKEELQIIQDLYSIMQKRFPNECYVDMEVQANEAIMVEPLLLMPLAENMFKHGDLRSEDDPGIIRIVEQNSKLHIFLRNKIMHGIPHEGTGIGLDNTRKRLDLVYGENYTMEAGEEGHYFEVNLEIDL